MNISFLKTTVLLGNAEVQPQFFEELYVPGEPLIAADGGANFLRERSLIPNAIIGDMDSLEDRAFFEDKCDVIEIEEQDSTDLEKCLMRVEAPLFLALGFLGKRFDHTLEVLHVLRKFADKKILFFSKEDVIFLLPRNWKLQLPLATRVSFYPLGACKVLASGGFKYPLDGLCFEQGLQIGTSNVTLSEDIFLQCDRQEMIGILPIEHWEKLAQSIL
jgi:thiamine pyrophosphokinase